MTMSEVMSTSAIHDADTMKVRSNSEPAISLADFVDIVSALAKEPLEKLYAAVVLVASTDLTPKEVFKIRFCDLYSNQVADRVVTYVDVAGRTIEWPDWLDIPTPATLSEEVLLFCRG